MPWDLSIRYRSALPSAVAVVMTVVSLFSGGSAVQASAAPISIGSRLEPFVDDLLIDKLSNTRLLLHAPTPKEVVMTFDAPWEGNCSACWTVFQDGPKYRMYYRAMDYDPKTKKYTAEKTACAESTDGIHWTRPSFGLVEHGGSKANNLIWQGYESHNFSPFIDLNPQCAPDARYKAVGGSDPKKGVHILKSSDGIHWTLIQPQAAITRGIFDSHNTAFWWTAGQKYLCFYRTWSGEGYNGVRDISQADSKDFLNWGDPRALQYGSAPHEHLYTNGILPYARAPHILMGFPKRFLPTRRKVADPFFDGLSEAVFMTSRDGLNWHRWLEAFVRPGLQSERWVTRNNLPAYGIVTTKSDLPGTPDELSIYTSEGYYVGPCRLRRFTLRMDGFVSVNAPYSGGELTTKPLVFDGRHLVVNYSTSAAGSLRVEIQDAEGKPRKGYSLADCPEIYGDAIDQVVSWKAGNDLSSLAGTPVRLRMAMKDADVYSIRFAATPPAGP